MRATIPHIDGFVHLNSAAGSLADQAVHDAIVAHLDLEARRGNTEARLAIEDRLEDLYADLSALARTPPENLSVSDSHTAAWQTAFHALRLGAGDRILVGQTEWGGNISAIWQRCRSAGAEVDVVPSDPSGAIDPEALAQTLDRRVKLVCVTWVPAVSGIVSPIERVTAVLGDHPAWLFVDASQAFGNIITDLSHPRFDLVTVSARKYLRGPRGTGFAAYSPRFLATVEPLGLDQFSGPWEDGGPVPISGARRFELRETSFAVRLGLAAAVKVALGRDLVADMSAIQRTSIGLREALSRVPGVTVREAGAPLSGIVTFSHDRLSPAEIRDALRARRINIAAPQTPYAPLWFAAGRPPVARLSPHAFNTQTEIEEVIDAIATF